MSEYSPHIYYREDEVERTLIQGKCFQNYVFHDYKRNLTRDNDFYPRRVHCDLIAVSKDYTHWAIVEIELANHDIQNHIWPQIIRLKEVCNILSQNERFRILQELRLPENVIKKLQFDQPRLMLIFDRSKFKLNPLLTYILPMGTLMFINAFKNDFNEFLYNEEVYLEDCITNKYTTVFPYGNRLNMINPSLINIDLSCNTKFSIEDENGNMIPIAVWNSFVKIPENKITTEMKIHNLDGTFKLKR